MHVLALLHIIMGKYQISCGYIEMAKRRLGQARNILKLGNVFFNYILPKSDPIKLA